MIQVNADFHLCHVLFFFFFFFPFKETEREQGGERKEGGGERESQAVRALPLGWISGP